MHRIGRFGKRAVPRFVTKVCVEALNVFAISDVPVTVYIRQEADHEIYAQVQAQSACTNRARSFKGKTPVSLLLSAARYRNTGISSAVPERRSGPKASHYQGHSI